MIGKACSRKCVSESEIMMLLNEWWSDEAGLPLSRIRYTIKAAGLIELHWSDCNKFSTTEKGSKCSVSDSTMIANVLQMVTHTTAV